MNFSKLTDGLKLLVVSGNYASINKTNFTAVFKEALDRIICLLTIKNGFRKTGIYPYNPDAIDKRCLMPTINTTPQPTETPHSSKTQNEIEKRESHASNNRETSKVHSHSKAQSIES